MPRKKKPTRGFRMPKPGERLARMTPVERAQHAIVTAKIHADSVAEVVRIGRAASEAYAAIGKPVGPDDPDPILTSKERRLFEKRLAEAMSRPYPAHERTRDRLLAHELANNMIRAADAVREREGLNRRKSFDDDPWSDWHPRSAFMRAVDDWKRANGKGKERLNITDWWARFVGNRVDHRAHDSKKRLWRVNLIHLAEECGLDDVDALAALRPPG
jgi:hypothetical protein